MTMFSEKHDNQKRLFKYSEIVFPKKIIINFFLSSALAIYAFFSVAFLLHGWALKRNEAVFNQQQVLQVLLSKQAVEESIYEMFYNLDVIQRYFRDDILDRNADEEKNRLFQFLQTSKQEIIGFLVSYSPGKIAYSNLSTGEREEVSKYVGSVWLDNYWKEIRTSGKEPDPYFFYISHNYRLSGNIIPFWEAGQLKGLICAVVDLKPVINRFIFPMSMGEYGTGTFLSGDGTIVFAENTENIGENIFSLNLFDPPMMKKVNDTVLLQTLGSGEINFINREGKKERRLAAWHSMNVGKQKLILLLTATDQQVNAALFEFQFQIIALGIALVIAVVSINFVLIASRKKIVQENARHLEVLVQQRTDELAISELRYQAVFQSANDAILIVMDNKIVNFNRKALEMFGYEESEFRNKSPLEVSKTNVDTALPQDQLQVYLNEALSGNPQIFEWQQVRKDGSVFDSEVSVSRLDLGEAPFLLSIIRDVTERKKSQKELQKLNAELEKRVLLRTAELEDSNIALKDSLDRLRETQKNLVEAEKMASLGLLVAGVAHEINTPVGISITAASYLMQQTEEMGLRYNEGNIKRSELEKYITTARESSKVLLENLEKASNHISSFKKVAVDQASREKRTFNLKRYINEVLMNLQPVLKKTNHTITVNGREDMEFESMPGALSQVITNLVMNSLKHGFEGIESGRIVIDADFDGTEASIRYSDNGIGMDTVTKERIFEPFFTTKRGSGGSGLGMHIVYNIVTQSLKGEITCKSSPGSGTIFSILWPVGIKQA